jgi:hypothetical protein
MTDPRSLDSVRAVVAEQGDAIRRQYRAVGTGIGRPDPAGPYVITVYVVDHADVPSDPGAVEGIALHFEVTGRFHSQPD